MKILDLWPARIIDEIADEIKYDCGGDHEYRTTLVLNALLHLGPLTETNDGYLTWKEKRPDARPTPRVP